ncbi:MAG TPA: hypothetical protein VF729_00975 [Solirubrobacterales bacterium]
MPGDQAFGGPGSDQCLGAFAVEDSCGPSGGSGGGGARVELYESIAGSSSLTITGDDQINDLVVSHSHRAYVVRGTSGTPVLQSAPARAVAASPPARLSAPVG